jgi:hypothetical protein
LTCHVDPASYIEPLAARSFAKFSLGNGQTSPSPVTDHSDVLYQSLFLHRFSSRSLGGRKTTCIENRLSDSTVTIKPQIRVRYLAVIPPGNTIRGSLLSGLMSICSEYILALACDTLPVALECLEGSIEACDRELDFLDDSTVEGTKRLELYRSRSRTTAGPTDGGGTEWFCLDVLTPEGGGAE